MPKNPPAKGAAFQGSKQLSGQAVQGDSKGVGGGRWVPSAGLLTPTSLLPSGLATFGVPCLLARPGLWYKAPLGALLQDQGLRVCHTPEV